METKLEKDIKLFDQSIKKWKDQLIRTHFDTLYPKFRSNMGSNYGPLCREYDCLPRANCSGCPIREHTGDTSCKNTPYSKILDSVSTNDWCGVRKYTVEMITMLTDIRGKLIAQRDAFDAADLLDSKLGVVFLDEKKEAARIHRAKSNKDYSEYEHPLTLYDVNGKPVITITRNNVADMIFIRDFKSRRVAKSFRRNDNIDTLMVKIRQGTECVNIAETNKIRQEKEKSDPNVPIHFTMIDGRYWKSDQNRYTITFEHVSYDKVGHSIYQIYDAKNGKRTVDVNSFSNAVYKCQEMGPDQL